MDMVNRDELHRTTKLELDEGRARTLDEAREIMAGYVLQLEVGSDVSQSETRQAMLLTAVNVASRAFLGGVRVLIHDNGQLNIGWANGTDMASAVRAFGGEVVESLDPSHPTLVIGDAQGRTIGSLVLHVTWEGWSGGVVEQPEHRLSEAMEFPLAGMLAAAIGVSEAFQNVRGNVVAGRRAAGLSLWNPEQDWRDSVGYGDACLYLPKRLWLIGLGHLGQAYTWALGLLPYEDRSVVEVVLQDRDRIVEANRSTGMLSSIDSIGQKKTRLVAASLEELGFNTAMTERYFDSATRRTADEPGVALVGVDDPEPRRVLEGACFDLVVDAGLGGGTRDYLDILIHSFPSGIKAAEAWADGPRSSADPLVDQPAYRDMHQRLGQTTGLTDGEIRCGIIEVAGASAGAAFVGCVAATLVHAEVLRLLGDGPRFEVVSVSLRSPDRPQTSRNNGLGSPVNPGFVTARSLDAHGVPGT